MQITERDGNEAGANVKQAVGLTVPFVVGKGDVGGEPRRPVRHQTTFGCDIDPELGQHRQISLDVEGSTRSGNGIDALDESPETKFVLHTNSFQTSSH